MVHFVWNGGIYLLEKFKTLMTVFLREIEMKTVTGKIRLLTVVVREERHIDKGLKIEICDGAINSPENRVRNSPGHLEGGRSSQFGHIYLLFA